MSGQHSRMIPASMEWTSPRSSMRLAEANNARLLDLSRADLVQAMDPEDVQTLGGLVSECDVPLHPGGIGKALIAMTPDLLFPQTPAAASAASSEPRLLPRPACGRRFARVGLTSLPCVRLQQRRLEGRSVRCRVDPRRRPELVRSHREPRSGTARPLPRAGSCCCWANRAAARPT